MFYNKGMDAVHKLKEVAEHMDLEPAEELRRHPAGKVAPCGLVVEEKPRPGTRSKKQMLEDVGVFHAAMPGGKTIPLLKTLLTSACERNCNYCPFRAGRNYKRVTFKPEEMAQTFMDMHRAGLVEGLFLSSGIIGGGQVTQDKLLDTVSILREKHKFPGYIHLKVMPGAEREQVRQAMRLVDRISTNLEAPNSSRLKDLAPLKRFDEELLQPLKWVEEIRRSESGHLGWNGRWPSTTTQFVVGALEESDLELLATSEYLFQNLRLGRTYYSAFSPVRDTPLEDRPAEDPLRQHRLYQASFLFRDYGFDLEDMPFDQAGNLPREIDPKLAWAETHLAETPVELNRAQKSELLRVPGLGPIGVQRILEARRQGTLGDVTHLRQLGLRTKPMEPFILLDGRRPSYQLKLF
jgi:predicted DNA-binding helix-hairpin-helix protein